jgi:hypothetical protein
MMEQKRERIERIKSHFRAAASHIKEDTDEAARQVMVELKGRLQHMGYTKVECEIAMRELNSEAKIRGWLNDLYPLDEHAGE